MAPYPLVLNRICSIVFLVSLFFLLSKPANAYFISNCSISQDEYTTNDPFHQNLKFTLNNLTVVANTTSHGFYTCTFGNKLQENALVFGLYLCRGDMTREQCSSCVRNAGDLITDECPNKKEVILWERSQNCTLRYANRDIFSKEEEEPSDDSHVYFKPAPSPNSPPPPPVQPFDVSEVIFNLINETAFGDYSSKLTPPFFATREDSIPGGWEDEVFYSLAQCTPDITPNLCYKCLKQAINLESCCFSTSSTQVYLPSCLLQYDVHNFFTNTNKIKQNSPPLLNNRLPPPNSDIKKEPEKPRRWSYIAVAVAVPSAVLALLLLFFICLKVKKSYAKQVPKAADEIITMESLQYDISTIIMATNNFSADSKLGQGRFCTVHKGKLQNGQEIAVKRLSSNFVQGIQEFKNDALVIAGLQHRNLVRLVGFCATEQEKLLIFEFLPNSSLDHHLFDPGRLTSLVWKERYKIIEGIAKGLLYLHEHSQYKIVHEDLKPSNILLDKDMTPKIMDFGTAKLFQEDQVRGINNPIVGTLGYMAPESIRSGELSVNSNIYSYGVIILEIVSGQSLTTSSIHTLQQEEGLLQRAWRLWNSKEALALMDPTMKGNYSAEEVTRCIHIGLLCVQEEAEKRPSIASIVSLLNSNNSNLPELTPGEGFYKSDNSTSSLGLHQSDHIFSGMEDITQLSAR